MVIDKRSLYFNLLLITVGLNIVLNYGFSNFGISVGVLVPFSQIVMLVGVLRIIIRGSLNKKFSGILILCIYAYVRLFSDMFFANKGVYALRDATNYMDILFVIIAYEEMKELELKGVDAREKFDRAMEIIYCIALVYVFTSYFPGSDFMKSFSPSYSGQQGRITFFGFYAATKFWIYIYTFYCYYRLSKHDSDIDRTKVTVYAVLGSLYFIIATGRTHWLILIIILLYLAITGTSKYMWKFYKYLAFALIVGIFIISFGMLVNSSFIMNALDSVVNIFLSMVGKGSNAAKVGGFEMRIEWFEKIFRTAFSDFRILIFGQGFGVALTDFISSGSTLVREPHNSFISVFARLGIVGEAIWIGLFIKVFSMVSYAYRNKTTRYASFGIFMILGAFVFANTEPFFEQTYCAMPFYTLLGCVLYFIDTSNCEEADISDYDKE
ncbi:MAG: hypothetical protein LUE12_08900 [Ruminococcus sp.]|nr:hypothetical protein [Ruminococcus sp.]